MLPWLLTTILVNDKKVLSLLTSYFKPDKLSIIEAINYFIATYSIFVRVQS